MNQAFKVLSMCDTCANHMNASWEYQADCNVSPNCRFAEELLPVRLLEDKNKQNAVIACTDYKEIDL